MCSRIELYIGGYQNLIPYTDMILIHHCTVVIDDRLIPNENMLSALA